VSMASEGGYEEGIGAVIGGLFGVRSFLISSWMTHAALLSLMRQLG
jgi:hypothetical protein